MSQPSTAQRHIHPARMLAIAVCALFFVLLLVLLICFLCGLFSHTEDPSSSLRDMPVALQSSSSTTTTTTTSTITTLYPPIASTSTKTVAITDDALIYGRNAVLIDIESHEIIAGKRRGCHLSRIHDENHDHADRPEAVR